MNEELKWNRFEAIMTAKISSKGISPSKIHRFKNNHISNLIGSFPFR